MTDNNIQTKHVTETNSIIQSDWYAWNGFWFRNLDNGINLSKKALKKAQKSLKIGGRIGVQTKRDTVMKISGIVDFITFCALGHAKIWYEGLRGPLKDLIGPKNENFQL